MAGGAAGVGLPSLQQQLADVNGELSRAQTAIDAAVKKVDEATDVDDRVYRRQEVAALREEKDRLREKERLLLLQLPPPPPPATTAAQGGVRPADAALQAFWRELPNAVVLTDDVLRLPEGVYFMGDMQLGSMLYVRPGVYAPLFEELLRQKQCGEWHIVLTGTPGVGKSVFLFYVLWRLAMMLLDDAAAVPPIIIVENQVEPLASATAFMRFEWGKPVFVGSMADFHADLAHKNAWYLVDGRGCRGKPSTFFPGGLGAFLLLATSPDNDYLNELRKVSMTKLYMPLWSWDELEAMRQLLWPGVSDATMAELIDLFGPLPRQVLRLATNWLNELELQEEEIAKADLETIRCLKTGKAGPVGSNKIIHVQVGKLNGVYDFTRAIRPTFASPKVREKILVRVRSSARSAVAGWLLGGAEGTLAGEMFEPLGHAEIPRGGAFKLCWLNSKLIVSLRSSKSQWCLGEKELLLPSVPAVEFNGMRGLGRLGTGQYGKPVQANFPAVDAVLLLSSCTLLFQFTVSARHPVTPVGLADVLTHLPTAASRNVVLVFVVPVGAASTAGLSDFRMSPADMEAVESALRPQPARGQSPATRAPDVASLAVCVIGLPVEGFQPIST